MPSILSAYADTVECVLFCLIGDKCLHLVNAHAFMGARLTTLFIEQHLGIQAPHRQNSAQKHTAFF